MCVTAAADLALAAAGQLVLHSLGHDRGRPYPGPGTAQNVGLRDDQRVTSVSAQRRQSYAEVPDSVF